MRSPSSSLPRWTAAFLCLILVCAFVAPAMAQEGTLAPVAEPIKGSATMQEEPAGNSAAEAPQIDCSALTEAEQQEYDALQANKDATPLEGADLLRLDTLAQRMACYSAQFAAPVETGPAGATRPAAPTVTKTVGGSGDYATLKAAFDDINNGTLTGAIQLDVIGDTTETATAVLNASGSGSASFTSVVIQPSGGAARTISGSIAGDALVTLNGADNVTIDGLNTDGNALTLSNPSTSATSGTSTLKFITDATNNTITNASILGSSTMASTTNGGNIWFAAGAVSTGNDNNVISNCNIGPAGTNLPTKAIYANGSTTTTTLYNSGNQITGNNIYDYFNATAASHGIYFAGGNTAWTISNNKFYQTATRTQTTGAIHAAIQVANSTGNDGHTISGNTIGYASAAGTGTYTVVFPVSTAAHFYGIYYSSAGSIATSSIQGNTITAINVSGGASGTSTTAAFGGILIGSGGAFNIGNVTGNTVGSLAAAGAITYSSSSTSSSEVYGIYFFPSYAVNLSNNSVGGITASNSSTGAIISYGLRAYTSSSVTNTMTNNTVGSAAAPISVSASSTSSIVVGLYCQSGVGVVTGNTIRNLTINSGNIGTGSSASVIGVLVNNTSATSNNISQNTIASLSNTNAAAAVWVTGLLFNGYTFGTHLVQRNFIHSLSASSTSVAATVNGIYVLTGLATYQNNMIVLGNDMTANSPQINGIYELVGTDNFYHNSVYIGGSDVAAGTAFSFAFNGVVTVNTRNYRDNIFFNARSNGAATGKHYAIQVGGTTANPAGLTSNNNILYAPGVGGFVGRFNAVDQATLANWQAATGQDANSYSVNPQYLAPAAPLPDLHLNGAVATVAEGNGSLIASVADDFDGETRSTLTPVDIGADAGNYIGIDLAPPTIVYTPLGNTTSTGDRTLTATLTDVTGVPTAGSLQPRIYYKKGAGGTWYSSQGSLSSGSGTNGTWNFTIVAADMGGVAAGDVIYYFVIAQDTAATPNIGSNPAGVVASDVNTVTTPPASPNTYTIVTPFSGSYDVGTGQTYTSLTNAGGIFEAINGSVLTGNVVINIVSDLSGELGTNALNQWVEEGAGGYSMLIKPSGAARTITGAGTGANLIKLNGADRVTIDGSLSGSTDRSLTISNPYASTSANIIWLASTVAPNGATNNTVKNCDLAGASPTTTLAAIISSGSTLGGVAEAANSNNTFQNNAITAAQYGIGLVGPTGNETGNVITENTIGSTVAGSKLGYNGIAVFQQASATVSKNTIFGVVTATTSTASGIRVAGTANGISIQANRISDVKNTNTTGYGSNGILLTASTTASDVTVANNFIFDVASYGYALSGQADNGYGIMVNAGGGYKIYYNSVLMATNQTATTGIPAAINIATGITTAGSIDLRNNIFANTQTVGTRYAIYCAAANTVFANIDYNDYYPGTGVTLGYLGSARSTLAAWQTATGQDANSLATDPLFVSNSDLHIATTGNISPVANAGGTGTGVTVDYDNEARNTSYPDVGADEFSDSGPLSAGTYGTRAINSGETWTLGGNVTFNGGLALNGGLLDVGANTLAFGPSATILGTPGASSMIVADGGGSVCKQYADGTSDPAAFTFPIGDNTGTPEYSPATLDFGSSTFASAQACVNVTNAKHPDMSSSNYLTRYWTVTQTGIATPFSCQVNFTYVDADVVGVESSLSGAKWDGGPAWSVLALVSPANNQFGGNVTNFSAFSAGSFGPNALTLSHLDATPVDLRLPWPIGLAAVAVILLAAGLMMRRKAHA